MVLFGEMADHKLCKFFYASRSLRLVNRKPFVNYSEFLFLVHVGF